MRKKCALLILSAWSVFGTPPEATDYHLYFWAQYNQSLDSNHSTIDTCYQILLNNNQKELVYPGYIAYLADAKRHEEIVALMPSVNTETLSEATQLHFAQALEAVGKKKEAEQLLMQLVKKQPTKADIVYYAASVYARNNDAKKALELIDHYLDNAHDTSRHFLFYFFQAQLYAQLNNYKSVEHALKKAIELNPQFEQAWLLLGVLYQELNQTDKALKLYQHAEQQLGNSMALKRQQLALQAKQYFVNHQQQKEAFDQALLFLKQNKLNESLEAIDQCLSYGTHDPSKIIKIELLCRLKKFQQALSWITEWIELDPEQSKWFELLEALHKSGVPTKDIKQSLETIVQAKGSSYLPNYYLGSWHLNERNYAQALAYLKKALSLTKDRKKQQHVAQLIMHGYELTKQWADLYEFATQVLNDIGNATVFFAYQALALAKDTKEYAKAQEIINPVLQREPENPLLQELQSYLMYKTNNLSKAQPLLEQLVAKTPHPKLYKRLAYIYYQQGNEEKARKTIDTAMLQTNDQSQKQKLQQLLDTWKKQ